MEIVEEKSLPSAKGRDWDYQSQEYGTFCIPERCSHTERALRVMIRECILERNYKRVPVSGDGKGKYRDLDDDGGQRKTEELGKSMPMLLKMDNYIEWMNLSKLKPS